MDMDELEISGKRYVSAKRIAKENKYHPDYIGQLIRAGRISGTKVGRAWYVDETTFANYLQQEKGTAPQTYTPVYTTPTPAPAPQPVQETPIIVKSVQPASFESVPAAPRVFSQTFSQEAAPAPVTSSPVQTSTKPFVQTYTYTPASAVRQIPVAPVQKPALTYVSDNSPLFPAVQKKVKEVPQPIVSEPVEVIKDTFRVADIEEMPAVSSKRSGIFKFGLALTTVVVVAGAFFTFTFFGSLGINSTVIVEQGKPASVIYSKEKTLCFIFGDCQTAQK